MLSASDLFENSLTWLRHNYASFCFFAERDIVWTVQMHLVNQIQEMLLPYRVFNDYCIMPGNHRSLLIDLAILSKDKGVDVAVEFKYEPSHRRSDILVGKFPVVEWGKNGILKDLQRIQEIVATGHARKACAIFIDEGGAFRQRIPHPDSYWHAWEGGVWMHRCDAISSGSI